MCRLGAMDGTLDAEMPPKCYTEIGMLDVTGIILLWSRLADEYRSDGGTAGDPPRAMIEIGRFLVCACGWAGIDATPLSDFVAAPNASAGLDAAQAVVNHLAERFVARQLLSQTNIFSQNAGPAMDMANVFGQASYFTLDQAATVLKCNRRSICRLIEKGRLPALNLGVGRHKEYRIAATDLSALRACPSPLLTGEPKHRGGRRRRRFKRLVGME